MTNFCEEARAFDGIFCCFVFVFSFGSVGCVSRNPMAANFFSHHSVSSAQHMQLGYKADCDWIKSKFLNKTDSFKLKFSRSSNTLQLPASSFKSFSIQYGVSINNSTVLFLTVNVASGNRMMCWFSHLVVICLVSSPSSFHQTSCTRWLCGKL